MVAENGTAVESVRDWTGARSATEAIALVKEYYGDVVESSELPGNEFVQVKKEELIGKQFLILQYGFDTSEEYSNQEYAWVRAILENNTRVYFSDGSTGVYAQLRKFYDETERDGGMLCRRGLRKSTYKVDVEGKETSATTFYIA